MTECINCGRPLGISFSMYCTECDNARFARLATHGPEPAPPQGETAPKTGEGLV